VHKQKQIQIAKHLLELKDARTTDLAGNIFRQKKSDYVSQDVAQREKDILFRNYPLLICLSCEIVNPGDYFCDDFSGVPIIVIRTSEGEVSAFRNICRHRGARLACDKGSHLRKFSCPYHAWSYATDTGDLISIPFNQGFDEIDKQEYGLVKLPVIEQYGMVFVQPTPGDEIELDDYLDGFAEDLAGFNLTAYHHFETRVLEAPLNWKLVVDTFMETYHLSTLHGNTVSAYLHNNLCHFDALGPHLRMTGARKTIDQLRDSAEEDWDLLAHTALVYVLFPNTVFIMQGDHLETWRVYPGVNPNESRMYVSLYTPELSTTESTRRHWNNNMDLLMATVLDEDFPLASNIQKDFAVCDNLLLFGRNEPALQHFHKTLADRLA
jgi:phenylpropionate dioxygenase-like ring-hydroxylating dioxygenase large terminal subunit